MKNRHASIIGPIFSLILASCGGSGGGGGGSRNTTPTNTAPVASAGADRAVDEQIDIAITGSGSDSDGTIVSFSWTQTGGTSVTVAGTNTAQLSFRAPSVSAVETLTFRLTVFDDDGASGSDSVSITVNPVNDAPTVNAGADKSADESTQVTLMGSASDDDGTIESYEWSQIDNGALTVALANPNESQSSFDAPDVSADTVFEFRLNVRDDEGAEASDTIQVTVRDLAPVDAAPTASAISLTADPSVSIIQQNLIASDPDGDSVVYELVSDESGTGYTQAYVNPNAGTLYLTLESGYVGVITILYRVSDGVLFSDPAEVTITVQDAGSQANGLGAQEIDPRVYSGFEIIELSGDIQGHAGEDATFPRAVDLSANFPLPGDQGQQGSCVGWATAYALKSYHERIEIGWSLNSLNNVFSPSYIYNQLNSGTCDSGSYIYEALQLIVDQGVSTWSSMPYSPNNCSTQPSGTAIQEASQFRAYRKARIASVQDAKAALVNRLPVVIGFRVYGQFELLNGPDAVYNTAEGSALGGHAATIIGYDDTRYGGAFRVINSWGRTWGDRGYFWLPYAFASQGIVNEAWVLEDAQNGSTPAVIEQTEPVPAGELPNLQVQAWSVSYDPAPGGQGTLEYTVINSGQGLAPQGADINLMLSKDSEITAADIYVVYEDILFDLSAGQTVYRNADNPLYFTIPRAIEPGEYYMGVWVDDQHEVVESNEDDNTSPGQDLVNIVNTKPDLIVWKWYADWEATGNGQLTYEIHNIGAESTGISDWDLNLVLSQNEIIGDGDEIFLFSEYAGHVLAPEGYIYRDDANVAPFNILYDRNGVAVPLGDYYIALWVDQMNQIDESNELNNYSLSWNIVTISASNSSNVGVNPTHLDWTGAGTYSAYNGKVLERRDPVQQRVRIGSTPDGARSLVYVDKPGAGSVDDQEPISTKVMTSRDSAIFPVSARFPMPDDRSHAP